jgi:hypothetical protein
VVTPAGVTHVIEVSLATTILVQVVPPMVTALRPVKFDPVIVTLVPPAKAPALGEILVTVGVYVNENDEEIVPKVVPTIVSVTAPVVADAGTIAVMLDVLTLLKLVALVEPNLTDDRSVPMLAPAIVTNVPPPVGPELGVTLVRVVAAACAVVDANNIAAPKMKSMAALRQCLTVWCIPNRSSCIFVPP